MDDMLDLKLDPSILALGDSLLTEHDAATDPFDCVSLGPGVGAAPLPLIHDDFNSDDRSSPIIPPDPAVGPPAFGDGGRPANRSRVELDARRIYESTQLGNDPAVVLRLVAVFVLYPEIWDYPEYQALVLDLDKWRWRHDISVAISEICHVDDARELMTRSKKLNSDNAKKKKVAPTPWHPEMMIKAAESKMFRDYMKEKQKVVIEMILQNLENQNALLRTTYNDIPCETLTGVPHALHEAVKSRRLNATKAKRAGRGATAPKVAATKRGKAGKAPSSKQRASKRRSSSRNK